MKEITEFRGDYRFLSNFYGVLIDMHMDGISFMPQYYGSVEHAYQAAKTLSKNERHLIIKAGSPGDAKKLGGPKSKGGIVTLRDNWEDIKLDVMYELLQQKFSYQNLRKMLLDTGSAELVEGNNWGDVVWGVCRGKGKNYLGKLLQRVRDEARVTDRRL